jgi:ABC-type transport system substrate-binding protein
MTMPASQYVNRRSEDPWAFTCDAGGFPSFGPDPAPYYDAMYNGPPGQGTRMAEHIPQEQIDLANEAGSTLDAERRGEIYSELQRMTVENPPHISLLTEQLVRIHQPCADPYVNPAASKDVAKYYDISGCERITF